MSKAYFQNGTNYDGQVVGVQGTQRMELREVGELVLVTVLDAVKGNVVLSKEYIQDDLADGTPTITLLGGFTNQDVAQLATEAELNAVNLQGKWNLAAGPPALDTLTSVISELPTNSYIGHITSSDLSTITGLNLLAGATIALGHRQKQKAGIPGGFANLGHAVMDFIGL